MKLKTFLFLLIVTTFTGALCFAQSEVGQGGDAVLKNGKYYLLDLVEAGIETTGQLDQDYTGCNTAADINNGICQWYNQFSHHEGIFGHDVARGVLNAMTHLPDLDALSMLKTIDLYDWNFVPLPLIDIRDVNTPVDLSAYPLYQLATRRDHTITINSLIWNQMDTLNKAALITHEVLYAMVRPLADSTHPGAFFQDSYAARQMNYQLYQTHPSCSPEVMAVYPCSPAFYFSSPRLRKELTNNEYTFSNYTTAFGNYGEADDFIGHDVSDGGTLVNKGYIKTGAYIKLEGSLSTSLVPGSLPANTVREKWVFFKDDAQDICAQLFINTGTYNVKVSLVRTLFTMELASYQSASGLSNSVHFTPSELPFSIWYRTQAGITGDTFEVNTADRNVCERQLKDSVSKLETLMRNAPDFIDRWLDAH